MEIRTVDGSYETHGTRAISHPKAGLGMSISPTGPPGGLAATVSTQFTTPGQPIYQEWDATAATRQGYLQSAYVMRCVRLRAETIAGLPFVAGLDMGAPEGQNKHAALSTLLGEATSQSPGGPSPDMTSRAFWIWSICQRIVTGRMGWQCRPNGSKKTDPILSLWPLVSANLMPVASAPGLPKWFDGYVYNTPLGDMPLKDHQVVYDWRMSAEDPRQAESVLQSASLPIQIQIALDNYMWGLLKRGMTASKMVVYPAFEEASSDRAWQAQFLSMFTGYDKSGSTVFAPVEADEGESSGKAASSIQVIDLAMNATDAQLYELAGQAKTDIEIALGVPESLIGNSSQRVYANADSEYRNFWTTTLVNDVAELQDAVNLRLAPQVGPEVGWFDLSQVVALQPPSVFMPPAVADLLNVGAVTVQDVQHILNLPSLEAKSEDLLTAPIGEEVDEASSSGGAGGRSVIYRPAHERHQIGNGYRAVHHGMRIAPNVFARKLPLNTETLRTGVWRVDQRRERVVASGHRAEIPALATEVATMVAARQRRREMGLRAKPTLVASGIALKAADTGRVLMLQRTITDQKDPARGKLEFAGGHVEPGEDSYDAAAREWSEEVGIPLPEGNVAGSWTTPNGVYRGHVVVVPHEADVAINPDRPKVKDPDNPRQKYTETAVWMDPDDLAGNPAVRDELNDSTDSWLPVVKAAQSTDGLRSMDLEALVDQYASDLLALVQ